MGVSGGYKGVPRADDLVRLLRGDRWVCFDRGLVGITDFGYGVAWLSLVVWLGVELTDTQTELRFSLRRAHHGSQLTTSNSSVVQRLSTVTESG